MALFSNWPGASYFGASVVYLNNDGTINGVVSQVPGASTVSPLTYNPNFVPKSIITGSASGSVGVKRPTQAYVYGTNANERLPLAYQYSNDDFTEEQLEFLTQKRFEFITNNYGDLKARLDLVPTISQSFTNIYDNRALLESKEVTYGPSTIMRKYYKIPSSLELDDLIADVLTAASNINGNLDVWDRATYEQNHPNGAGNYYAYLATLGLDVTDIRFNLNINPNLLSTIRPIGPESIYAANIQDYWDPNVPQTVFIQGPTTNISYGPGLPGSRRDTLYANLLDEGIKQLQGLTKNQVISELQGYLPASDPLDTIRPYTYKADGVTPVRDISFYNNAFGFTSNLNILPYVQVTAYIQTSGGTAIATKGTYSHIELKKVQATGDQYTPSVVICHDRKKIYYFIYGYMENRQNLAYGVASDCEENDQRWYL